MAVQASQILTTVDQNQVIMLLRRAWRYHMHLDWRSFEQWLSDPALCCRVLYDHGSARALAGATLTNPTSRSKGHVAWLRFLVPDQSGDKYALDDLWQDLRADLAARNVRQVGILIMDTWVTQAVARWGFTPLNEVVTLRRVSGYLPPPPEPPYALREVAAEADLSRVVAIDRQAFDPLWQYSLDTLRVAQQEAVTFSLLERDGQPLGYQLSTQHMGTGHLARLAVLPSEQGKGLGAMLIGGMLRFMQQRGIHTVTVNTQSDNTRSQRLYRQLGFETIGDGVPVWTLDL